MRQPIMDYLGSLNTLIAVFVGAILATGGALMAEIIQDRRNRKRRERDAARFFGDILISIDQIIDFAFRSQKIGDPWGTLTVRLYKTALKEAAVYERNRERLFDLQDMGLRSRIHRHFLTETFPIEALIENSEEIAAIKAGKKQSKADKAALDELRAARVTGLNALRQEHAKTQELCRELEKIAGVSFAALRGEDAPAPPIDTPS